MLDRASVPFGLMIEPRWNRVYELAENPSTDTPST
jgi:hypothetical protein